MHHKSQVIKYTAIKQLIYSNLLTAISIYANQQHTICIDPQKIHLHKDREKFFLQYVSGVALSLRNSHNSPMYNAREIVSILSEVCCENARLMIKEPGLIQIEVNDPIISIWLQNFLEEGVGSGELAVGEKNKEEIQNNFLSSLSPLSSSSQFPTPHPLHPTPFLSAQYAHARCCSLTRLCLSEGLIKLDKNGVLASPLPWLDSDNKLRFHENAERVLLNELIQVVDDIVCPSSNNLVNWEKVTFNLSQAFDNFWRHCRIIRNNDIELARARFGLILAVRSVLQFLLEKKLGVFAPLEL